MFSKANGPVWVTAIYLPAGTLGQNPAADTAKFHPKPPLIHTTTYLTNAVLNYIQIKVSKRRHNKTTRGPPPHHAKLLF